MNSGFDKYKINYRGRDFWKGSFGRGSPSQKYLQESRLKSKSRSRKYIINNEVQVKRRAVLDKEKENNVFYHPNNGKSRSRKPLSRKGPRGSPNMMSGLGAISKGAGIGMSPGAYTGQRGSPQNGMNNMMKQHFGGHQRSQLKQKRSTSPMNTRKRNNDRSQNNLSRRPSQIAKSPKNRDNSAGLLNYRQAGKSMDILRKGGPPSSPVAPNSPKAKIDGFRIEKLLGKGSYALVKLGIHKQTGKQFAIKIYEKRKLYDPLKKASVEREIKIMKKLEHPHVISYINDFQNKNQIFLVMEYVGSRSLYEYVKSGKNRHLTEMQALLPFRQLCEAVNYCHQRKVFHRDLKLENVLFPAEENCIKLIDFGFAVGSKSKLKTFCGTPTYMAPEIVRKKEYYGANVDVWAMGIMLYRILTGTYPFRAKKDRELYRKIYSGRFDDSILPSPEARDLIGKMLKVSPEQRCSMEEVLAHSWFAKRPAVPLQERHPNSPSFRRQFGEGRIGQEPSIFGLVYGLFFGLRGGWESYKRCLFSLL